MSWPGVPPGRLAGPVDGRPASFGVSAFTQIWLVLFRALVIAPGRSGSRKTAAPEVLQLRRCYRELQLFKNNRLILMGFMSQLPIHFILKTVNNNFISIKNLCSHKIFIISHFINIMPHQHI
jgi:hypothetical protein